MKLIKDITTSGNYPTRHTYYQCENEAEYEAKWQNINSHYKVWAERDKKINGYTSILQLDGFNDIESKDFNAIGINVCLQQGNYSIFEHYLKPSNNGNRND